MPQGGPSRRSVVFLRSSWDANWTVVKEVAWSPRLPAREKLALPLRGEAGERFGRSRTWTYMREKACQCFTSLLIVSFIPSEKTRLEGRLLKDRPFEGRR